MKNFSKLTDNLLIFFIVQIVIGFMPLQAWTQNLCIDLFNAKPPSPSAFDQNFADNETFIFPSNHFRKLFVYGQHGIVNFQESGQNFRNQLSTVTSEVRLKRAAEVEQLLNVHLKQAIPLGRSTDLWSALIVLNPNQGIQSFTQHLRSHFSKTTDLIDIANFVRSFEPALAETLAAEILKDYESLNKSSSRNDSLLSPKRAALYMSKYLLQWPKKLKSKTQNGAIRFGDYDEHLNQVRKLTGHPVTDSSIATAKQVGLVIKILQEHLMKWKQLNPESAADVSIVVTGSFPNGLPTNSRSDIDIVVFDQNLRTYFFSGFRKYELQRSIDQAVKLDGYTGPNLPLTDVVEAVHRYAPGYFYDRQKVVEHGSLGSVSFEIFPDHVDLIIHDQPTPENKHVRGERFRTE